MSKTKKIWIISASIAVAVGIIIAMLVDITTDFALFQEHNVITEVKTYSVDKEFKNIKVEDVEYDVFLVPTKDEKCKVVCNEGEKLYHTVEVVGDILTIKRINTRKWYESIYFGFSFGGWDSLKMTVYLPEKEYQDLYITTTSGDVLVEAPFKFSETKVYNTSGDVILSNITADNITATSTSGEVHISSSNVKENLDLRTTSGDVSLSDVTAKNITSESTSGEVQVISANVKDELYSGTTSGDVNISNVKTQDVSVKSTSGDVELIGVISLGDLKAKTVSGEIDLDRCDGKFLNLETTSGDVDGSLLREKLFITDTTSGEVNVPIFTSDEKCMISTVSGDIEIVVLK